MSFELCTIADKKKRKEKKGGTIENFENGEPRENAYRESSPLSVVDGRVVQGLNDEYTDRCRLKWKKDKPRARCVCKRRERERERVREKWEKSGKWRKGYDRDEKFEREWQ